MNNPSEVKVGDILIDNDTSEHYLISETKKGSYASICLTSQDMIFYESDSIIDVVENTSTNYIIKIDDRESNVDIDDVVNIVMDKIKSPLSLVGLKVSNWIVSSLIVSMIMIIFTSVGSRISFLAMYMTMLLLNGLFGAVYFGLNKLIKKYINKDL